MQNLNIIYKHGHFYDVKTEKRIHFKDGANFSLQGEDRHFETSDPLNQQFTKSEILDSNQKLKSVISSKKVKRLALLFKAGAEFKFRLGLSKRKTEDESMNYWFLVKTLEDLYLYSNKVKGDSPPSLLDCRCVVSHVMSENIDYFEPLYAESLNKAFIKTSTFYFSSQRTPAANVFLEFTSIGEEHNGLSIGEVRMETELILHNQ
ncbi:MAG: hypothetical protein AB8H03_27190 [Saprospiraceae bacterium]